jgi:MFS family permease
MTAIPESGSEPRSLRELTAEQKRCGMAAWLGWLFDGLDSYLYVLVAVPFVTSLMHNASKQSVANHSAYIQAAFLVGWALGGAVFGWVGDRFGRSRTMAITILTYALFTGFSALSWNWQSLLVFRFISALGIGGEWAAGSSLVAETWPKGWRTWTSAALQSAYQLGIIAATLTLFFMANLDPKSVFLIGAAPALITFWIRKQIPEPDEWHTAKSTADHKDTGMASLFQGPVLKTTIQTVAVCSVALTTTWGYLFWFPQHLRKLPDVMAMTKSEQGHYVALASALVMFVAIFGNFFAAGIARKFGYRLATATMFLGGLITLYITYGPNGPKDHITMLYYIPWAHFFVQGVFGLFPLYIPPLFPTLLRTKGAGFSYNFGRIVAAVGTIFFGLKSPVKDLAGLSHAMVLVSMVYIPGIIIAFLIPEPPKE